MWPPPVSASRSCRSTATFNLVFSPDGSTLAVAEGRTDPSVSDARVVLWDVATGVLIDELQLEGELAETQLYEVVFSPGGAQLAVSGINGSVALWDLATTTARVLSTDHVEPRSKMAIHPATGVQPRWSHARHRRRRRDYHPLGDSDGHARR